MKTEILASIAREKLDLETLETRKSDRLDFHDLAVWEIRAALDAAYQAGFQAASPKTPGYLRRLHQTTLNGKPALVTIPEN